MNRDQWVGSGTPDKPLPKKNQSKITEIRNSEKKRRHPTIIIKLMSKIIGLGITLKYRVRNGSTYV